MKKHKKENETDSSSSEGPAEASTILSNSSDNPALPVSRSDASDALPGTTADRSIISSGINRQSGPKQQASVDSSSLVTVSRTDTISSERNKIASESEELEHRRQASRISSMRCQQKKRRRIDSLKESQDRLRTLNKNLTDENRSLKALIQLLKDAPKQPQIPQHFNSSDVQSSSSVAPIQPPQMMQSQAPPAQQLPLNLLLGNLASRFPAFGPGQPDLGAFQPQQPRLPPQLPLALPAGVDLSTILDPNILLQFIPGLLGGAPTHQYPWLPQALSSIPIIPTAAAARINPLTPSQHPGLRETTQLPSLASTGYLDLAAVQQQAYRLQQQQQQPQLPLNLIAQAQQLLLLGNNQQPSSTTIISQSEGGGGSGDGSGSNGNPDSIDDE